MSAHRSELQQAASRENGRKGGRPRMYWCHECCRHHKWPVCKPTDPRVSRRRKTQEHGEP